jgi:hypothetical protein
MAVSYTCPNPDCGVTLKTPNRVAAGKSVSCPKCGKPFVPEANGPAADAGTLKMVDEEPPKNPPKKKSRFDDDEESDESVKKGYGVVKETEEEIKEANKNKPTFTEVQDKFKKSARGPAQSLLVLPSNLLTFEGILTVVAGVLIFIVGMWPLVFNDAPPGEEEMEEAVATMLIGVLAFLWGGMVCFGASHMQELGSYTWSWVGSVMGLVPLLAGVFAIMMLLNPKVKAGFEEAEAGPDEEDVDDDDEDDEDDDEDGDGVEDDDDDDEDGGITTKKAGRKLLKGLLGGEDEDEE